MMAEVSIKFYSIDKLYFLSSERAEQLLKEDFQEFYIKSDETEVTILENKNQILCNFQLDTCHYEKSDSMKKQNTPQEPANKSKDTKNTKENNGKQKNTDKKQTDTPQDRQQQKHTLKIFWRVSDTQNDLFIEIVSKSSTIIQEIIQDIKKRQTFIKYKGPLALQPAKMPRTSLLSTESPIQNYRGFLNVLGIVFIVQHFRQMYETYFKYDFFMNRIEFTQMMRSQDTLVFILILIGFTGYFAVVYTVQKLLFKEQISMSVASTINFLTIAASVIIPLFQLRLFNVGVAGGIVILMLSVIIFAKLISYTHVMRNIYFLIHRIRAAQKEKKDIHESISKKESNTENINMLQKFSGQPHQILKIRDLIYFAFIPTLCFQLVYPRTPRIRIIWLAKRLVEYVFTVALIGYLWFQHLQPTLEESYFKLQENKLTKVEIFYVFLNLCIPNLYLWVLGFFSFFHIQLNILSELLKYGDRQFYLAWWNCKDVEEYWRLWNLPVHNFLLRHLYNPLLKRGVAKVVSNFIVFFVSAVLHEYIVSGALGIVSYHAFAGMMAQAPTIFIQKKINKYFRLNQSELGNVTFWIAFCFIGQPMGIFLYYELYMNSIGAKQG